jgi:hypothetical protein
MMRHCFDRGSFPPSASWSGRFWCAVLTAMLCMPTWGQPPAEDAVSPERIHELMRRFDSLSTAGKSAVLDYLIEAANKPADRLVDTLPLRQALRSSGPQIARLANDPQSPLRLQALAALGKVHCAVDDVVPAWRSALAENRFELDQAVGAGALAYLRRGHQVREGAMMETKLALLESVVTDLNGLAPLLPRLQRSPVLATRINAYEAVGAFFELLGNVLEREGEAQIPALVSIRRQLALLPENLAGFFREAQTALAKFQAPDLRSVSASPERPRPRVLRDLRPVAFCSLTWSRRVGKRPKRC